MEELDLKSLLLTMWEKKMIIVAITAIFAVIGAVYSFFFITPKYESYTQLLLAGTTTSQDSSTVASEGITQAELNLNKSLVATYSTLLKTKMVLSDVLKNVKSHSSVTVPSTLNESVLEKNITVSSVTNTDIINISVRNEDPELAKVITEELAQAFIKKVNEVYHLNNVNIVENPEANYNPININHTKDIILFMLIGVVIACGFIFVMEMFNVSVKTVSDIEKITNIPVIAEISLITNRKGEM